MTILELAHHRVHALREHRGLSKRALAQRSGCWRGVLDHPPEHVSTLAKLAIVLRTWPSDLVAVDGFAVRGPVEPDALDAAVRTTMHTLRQREGWGIKTASKLSGTVPSWVTRIENRNTEKIDLVLLERYVGGFGLSLSKFLAMAEQAAEVVDGCDEEGGARMGLEGVPRGVPAG